MAWQKWYKLREWAHTNREEKENKRRAKNLRREKPNGTRWEIKNSLQHQHVVLAPNTFTHKHSVFCTHPCNMAAVEHFLLAKFCTKWTERWARRWSETGKPMQLKCVCVCIFLVLLASVMKNFPTIISSCIGIRLLMLRCSLVKHESTHF